jgi:hypothetical protein
VVIDPEGYIVAHLSAFVEVSDLDVAMFESRHVVRIQPEGMARGGIRAGH